MNITDEVFYDMVNYIQKNYGINLKNKKNLIVGRLENYLVRNGYKDYREYMEIVKNDKSGAEANVLINYITTNHTYFLREMLHFNYLKDVILPRLYEKEQSKKSIYLWSAASSTGEEPYSIVMTLRDFFYTKPGWDTRILATDVSTQALNKGIAGIYMNEQLDALPDSWKRRYFENYSDTQKRVRKEIRDEVIFRQQNLMKPFSFKNKFHIVFLRNVMIYFEDDTKFKLVNKIYDCMQPGGYLIIGLSEVLDKRNTNFKYIQSSIYQKI